MMNVFCLLYCRTDVDLPGNLLFFDTVRVGFPDAEINIFDNFNPDYRDQFKERAAGIGAEFHTLDQEISHQSFISQLAENQEDDFYIIDPDTVWFSRMPDRFDAVMAGRLIPRFYDSFTGCDTFARIHTSCLWLSPKALRECMPDKFAFRPFDDVMFRLDGKWYRYDTGSMLYHAMPEKVWVFDGENNRYAHLFCGTHMSVIGDHYPLLSEIHDSVAAGGCDFSGLYAKQHEFFCSL